MDLKYRKELHNMKTFIPINKASTISCFKEGMANNSQVTSSGILLLNNSSSIPLAKEIENRLEVVSKVVPQEEVYQVSQEYINKLNAIFFEKVADQIVHRVSASSINGGNSICGSTYSQNVQPSNKDINTKFNNTNNTANRIFNAAREIQKSKNLPTINEINEDNGPFSSGLFIPRKETKQNQISRTRGKKPVKILQSVLSGQNSNKNVLDFDSNRNPLLINTTSVTKTNKTQSKVPASRRKKQSKYSDDISDSQDLNITKNSLRNSTQIFCVPKTKTVTRNKKQEYMKNIVLKKSNDSGNETSDLSVQESEDENYKQNLKKKPKKTALSPFFNRLKPNMSSTPLNKVRLF